jgi:acyl-CoA thioesterase II
MDPTLPELLRILDLEPIELNAFRGHHPEHSHGRVFGGQIMAQALMAAGRTVEATLRVHSLHGYFLRPGDSRLPVLFSVDRIRDGRSFATRRVVAIQRGAAIFEMSASFQRDEQGFTHQARRPQLSPPTRIPPARLGGAFISMMENWKFMRDGAAKPPYKRVWFRVDGELDPDPLLHACLLTYQSDSDLLSTARLPHAPLDRSRLQRASLDHALWFHRPARLDQWLLYDLDSPSAAQARGFSRGELFQADGTLVASAMQESLMRMR